MLFIILCLCVVVSSTFQVSFAANPDADLVFVANVIPPGIFVAPADTFNFTQILGAEDQVKKPIAIDYDPVDAMVYWTDVSSSTINRAFLDGTGFEVVLSGLQTPDGLTLDLENRAMYWTDAGSDLIERSTMNGQDRAVVFNLTDPSLNGAQPRAIILDPSTSTLYWTDWGSNPSIQRVRTDGSGHQTLISTLLGWPNGLALDPTGGRLYWCDAKTDRIESSDLLGQDRKTLLDLSAKTIHPFDIAVYNGYVYWSDWVSRSLLRVDLLVTSLTERGSKSFPKAVGLHIYEDTMTDHSCRDIAPCQHGAHCRQFSSHYECVCQDGFTGMNCQNGVSPPTCPSNIRALAEINATSVPVSWPEVTASDPSSQLLWSSSHRPGDMFPVGVVTMVIYVVADQEGNSANCNFTVSVTGVGLDCPSDVTAVTAPGIATANVTWTLPNVTFSGAQREVTFYVGSPPTAGTGDDDTQVHVYSDYQPGDAFRVGTTVIAYQIQELGTQCGFRVIIRDVEPPRIHSCPDDVTIPVTSSSNQVSHRWILPDVSDNSGQFGVTFSCSATTSNGCNQAGSGTFSVGVTMVKYRFGDLSGNENVCAFKVTVSVVQLVCTENVKVLAGHGANTTSVNWPEPDLTGWNGPTNITSSAKPGAVFPIGLHVVSYHQWFALYDVTLECSFSVMVVGRCASDITHAHDGSQNFTWSVTIAGSQAESYERCGLQTINAGDPLAVRNCSIVEPPTYFQWQDPEPRSCGAERDDVTLDDVEDVEVTEGNAVEVAEFLADQTSESSDKADDVEAISNILKNIVEAETGDKEVTALVVQTVNNVIRSAETTDDESESPGIDASSSSAIIKSVETQVSLTLQKEGNISIQQESIHVKAVSLDPEKASRGFSFVSTPLSPDVRPDEKGSLAGTEVKTYTNTSAIPKDVVASIRLPANIVDLLKHSNGNGSKQLRASFIVYADDTLFQSARIKGQGANGSRLEVGGSVVSLTVEDVELVNLTEPVVIEFKTPVINATEKNRTTIQCVFWDFKLNDEVGDWSTAGCELSGLTNDRVSCHCSHATNFAILLDVKGQKPGLKVTAATRALDIISQVGCALSIVALAITVAIYLAIRKLRSGISRQIFIHFCFSLLMLYIVFLAGVDNARGSGGGCVFVAALLHYLTLSTMLWMAVEARNMYVSTVKVFPEDQSRYMVKACLFAWGSPLVILTITLAAATDHYKNEHYCFPEPGLVLYLGLLLPIGLILIHNIITFILVMRSLLKVKEASRSQQISKRLQNAVGISALMGLTWCFGFLAIGEATFAFQLIFTIANSLQGVVVFIMFCARREEVRTALAPYMKRICCGRDCRIPGRHLAKSSDSEMASTSTGLRTVGLQSSTAQTTNFDSSI